MCNYERCTHALNLGRYAQKVPIELHFTQMVAVDILHKSLPIFREHQLIFIQGCDQQTEISILIYLHCRRNFKCWFPFSTKFIK